MRRILLINPNSSAATTEMMVSIAQAAAADACDIAGATARRAPPMIVEPDALALAADEVIEIAVSNNGNYDGFIVADVPDSMSAAAVSLAVASTGGFAHLETHELFTADQLAPLVAKAKAVRGGYKAPGA